MILCKLQMQRVAYEPVLSRCILFTTVLIHPIHIYAAYITEHSRFCCMGVALLLTSVNYWRNPDMQSMRRITDMAVAKTSILTHIAYAAPASRAQTTMIVGVLCYCVSLVAYQKKLYCVAATLHILLHIVTSIGATMMYLS